jgi:hypothetical protein
MELALHYINLLFYANQKLFQEFKWLGNALLMTAAASVAVSSTWAQQVWPFVLYTVGAGIWMYAGILMRDRPLVYLNLFFVVIDVYGIFERL